MIINRPTQSSLAQTRTRPARLSKPNSDNAPEEEPPGRELGFEDWVDQKLTSEREKDGPSSGNMEMDKSKRKYYNKRRKRMYGTDSDEDDRRHDDGFVELKPEVVDFPRLHKREEELYFYDTFAYPWEKDKHYRMVYQLEKKYFPDQCLDKAFLEPGQSNANANQVKGKLKTKKKKAGDKEDEEMSNKGLVFFEEERKEESERESVKNAGKDVMEKKVDEFFKCLKKLPNEGAAVASGEPYLVTRSTELPPRWDTPNGTVVLVNKPKGKSVASLVVSLDMKCDSRYYTC